MSIAAIIFIAPHERAEAIEAYRDHLTAEQVEEINDAPETAFVKLSWGLTEGGGSTIVIIEEG
jgi:hypothetical protein